MPLREYACGACGLRFERLINGFNPPPLAVCPCGKKAQLQFPVCSVVTSSRNVIANPKVKGDVMVGHLAEQAWGQYDTVRRVKEPLRRQAKQQKTGLTIDVGEGHVRTMSHQELDTRKQTLREWSKTERQVVEQKKKARGN